MTDKAIVLTFTGPDGIHYNIWVWPDTNNAEVSTKVDGFWLPMQGDVNIEVQEVQR